MSWKEEIKKDFGEADHPYDAMKGTREFINDLEEFKQQLIKTYSSRPLSRNILEILNRNLEEMKERLQ